MLHLDYRDSRPLHQQVRDGLRRLMFSGVLQAGDQLPSVRKLATELAINPNTIQRAYAQLEAEGYVYSVAGRGSFVAENGSSNPLMSCGSSVQTSPRMISRSSPCLSSSRAADSRVKAMFSCSPCV